MWNSAARAGFNFARTSGPLQTVAAAIWLVLMVVAFSGLGLLTRRLLRISSRADTLPALGLATFIFAGGILNDLHLAFPAAIGSLLGGGFLLSALAVYRRFRASQPGSQRLCGIQWSAGILVLAILVFGLIALAIVTQLSPRVYNWRDDLQKYFAHPVRMLETGTLFGSPLSAIGAESLGGIAVVQSCVLLWLPLRCINSADAILGLFLLLVPLFAFGTRNPKLWPIVAVALISTVVIDPYYVNTSALYLGSALVVASIVLTCEGEQVFTGGNPAALGLLYATLIALKPTFGLFSALHLGASAAGVCYSRHRLSAGIRWGGITAGWMTLFLAPWVLLHLPNYLEGLQSGFSGHSPALLLRRSINLLGADPLEVGLTGLRAFSILVSVIAVFAIVGVAFSTADRNRGAIQIGVVVTGAVVVAGYPTVLFVFPHLLGYADADPNAVRYFVPILIGIFPITFCLGSQIFRDRLSGFSRTKQLGLCLSLELLALVNFAPTAAVRIRDVFRFGTLLPFPVAHEPSLAMQMDFALTGGKQIVVRNHQEKIPRGASLIAWVNTPYLLDYARNPIFDAETAGISNRWARIPLAEFVLWEYRGYPNPHARTQNLVDTLPTQDRARGDHLLAFDRQLSEWLRTGTVIFRDDDYILFRVTSAP